MDIMEMIMGTGTPLNDQIALNDLRRIVNSEAVEDTFEVGTIIGWQQNGYLYAAIKTPVGWTTTAGESNHASPQIPRTTDFVGLSTLLSLDKVTRVAVFLGGVVIKGN